jgi:hypothetical protein
MAKSTKAPSGLDAIELHPDAWARFERYVDTSVRTRPAAKPKAATSRPKATSKKRRKTA